MAGLFDKFSKVLQVNRNFKRKDFDDARYISKHVSENILERWHVHKIKSRVQFRLVFRKSKLCLKTL